MRALIDRVSQVTPRERGLLWLTRAAIYARRAMPLSGGACRHDHLDLQQAVLAAKLLAETIVELDTCRVQTASFENCVHPRWMHMEGTCYGCASDWSNRELWEFPDEMIQFEHEFQAEVEQ